MSNIPPALAPIYPYGRPAEPISLHEGSISVGGRFVEGRIEFRLAPRPEVTWAVEPGHRVPEGQLELGIEHAAGPARLVGQSNRRGLNCAMGWVDVAEVGSADAELDRVLVHWLNLPALASATGDLIELPDGTEFPGRWSAELGGWTATVDRRHDHREVWKLLRAEGAIAITHVMEIRRTNGGPFAPAEVEPVLDALHLGMSFALGRWVAPALPVGLDSEDRPVWEQWGARHCTAGAPGTLRWWFEQRDWELAELLRLLVDRFVDPDQQFSLRFLLSSAVLSAGDGFVEQRIMTAFAAIEHLTWTRLVTIGRMSRTEYKDRLRAHERLSRALAEAAIMDGVDPAALPALHEAAQRLPPDLPRTGPAIAAHVRNMIVHPTDHEEKLYRRDDGLIEQAWCISQHYLVLLVLHHLAYTGSYRSMLKPGGWAGNVEPVPWTAGCRGQHNPT